MACSLWFEELLKCGADVRIPEIVDYEVRRAFLRTRNTNAVAKLDALKEALGYIPLTTETMLKAAEFWADMRQRGYRTADDRALDGDVILAAQAAILDTHGDKVMIATANIKQWFPFEQQAAVLGLKRYQCDLHDT
jgi:predicted nucleic acid-binding protein